MFFSVSDFVAPVETTPSKSGEYALYPVLVFSNTTKYFFIFVSVVPA
jgi:hypothetical protein